MMDVAAEYTDPDRREFVFFVISGEVHCYEKKKHGGLHRRRNWDIYPERTKITLLQVVGFLKMDTLFPPRLDPTERGFRFFDKGGCGDCNDMFA